MAGNILSPEEHQQLTTTPSEISETELVRFFTLTSTDLALVDQRLRSAYRLDQVAHLCLLRWLGWSPVVVDRLPEAARVALCRQSNVTLAADEIEPPAARTSRLHAERARQHLGWRAYTPAMDRSLREWLTPVTEEYDQAHALLDAVCRHLYREKVVRPGPDRLERLVEATRLAAREHIAQAITSQLAAAQKQLLFSQLDQTGSLGNTQYCCAGVGPPKGWTPSTTQCGGH